MPRTRSSGLRADGLVSADADGRFSAIAPEDARAHLDRLWDRLLDVDTSRPAAESSGRMMHQASIEADAPQAEQIVPRSRRRSSRKRSRSGCSIAEMAASRSSPITPKSPPRDALLLLIARASGDGALGALHIEALPEADWVTLSQGQRGPVAGRPVSRAWQP